MERQHGWFAGNQQGLQGLEHRSCLVPALITCALALWLFTGAARAVTTSYVYDALGRLTFVVDPVNGNRDYDYDQAGNRLLVAVGAADDAANDPSTAAPSAPSALIIPPSSATGSYTITWGTAAGVLTAYELWEATNPAFTGQVRVYSGAALSYNASGRSDGTYYYRVRACNGATVCGAFRGDGTSGTTVLLTPGLPGSMTVPSSAIPGNNYTISWGLAGGTVATYQIEQHSNAAFTALVNGWSTTSISASVLASAEGTFYFRVRACNASGCGSYRNGPNGIVILSPPATPTGLSLNLVSFCTWNAQWNAVTGASSYSVVDTHSTVRTTAGTNVSVPWSASCPPPAGSSPDDNRPVSVKACNSAGCSANAAFSTQPVSPPAAPSAISYPSASSSGTFTISWSNSTNPITNYQVDEATNAGFTGASTIYDAAGTSTSRTRGDGTYYYRVRACNGTSCSGYTVGTGAITVTLLPGAPGSMSVPSAATVGSNYAISWGTAGGTIARYEVEQHSNPSFTALVLSWNTTSTSSSVAASSVGTFYFRVRACNVSGCSAYSNATNGTTITNPVPPVPTGLSMSLVSFCTWSASWSASSGATSYSVIDTLSTVRTTSSPSISIPWSSTCPPPPGVNPNSNKPLYVKACNSAGCSANATFPP